MVGSIRLVWTHEYSNLYYIPTQTSELPSRISSSPQHLISILKVAFEFDHKSFSCQPKKLLFNAFSCCEQKVQ